MHNHGLVIVALASFFSPYLARILYIRNRCIPEMTVYYAIASPSKSASNISRAILPLESNYLEMTPSDKGVNITVSTNAEMWGPPLIFKYIGVYPEVWYTLSESEESPFHGSAVTPSNPRCEPAKVGDKCLRICDDISDFELGLCLGRWGR